MTLEQLISLAVDGGSTVLLIVLIMQRLGKLDSIAEQLHTIAVKLAVICDRMGLSSGGSSPPPPRKDPSGRFGTGGGE